MDSNPNTQALPAGTRLEEFLIDRVLGAGGFGITYLAADTALGRQVVIKENLPVQFCFRDTHSLTVAPRHAHGEDADNFAWSLENFSKEAAMLASLDHPGIVKVLRSFEAFGTAYFVMPFVEGVTLDELAKQRHDKPFSEDELRGVLEYVLMALNYLHDRGIYHRDIKPGNILITNEGIPVLIDFGSARQKLSERSMTVVESAGYTPFEQLQSRGNVGPWSDLYALGATMAKIITGAQLPKAADRILSDPWDGVNNDPWTSIYSKQLLASIDQAMVPHIEGRWQSGLEWIDSMRNSVASIGNPAPGHDDLDLTESPSLNHQMLPNEGGHVRREAEPAPWSTGAPGKNINWSEVFRPKSCTGRIGISPYWLGISGVFFRVLILITLAYLSDIIGTDGLIGITLYISSLVLFIFTTIVFVRISARRLHDINLSPHWLWLLILLVPLFPLLIIPVIFLGLIKGSKGENKYGPPPAA